MILNFSKKRFSCSCYQYFWVNLKDSNMMLTGITWPYWTMTILGDRHLVHVDADANANANANVNANANANCNVYI